MVRKILLFAVFAFLPLASSGQTQQGFVKTKGRMVNGRHVAGQGLPGTTVSIQGGNSVGVKNANGSFSFMVPAKTFMVQSVQKKGYELVDADAVRKPYQHSANPLYLVMETPEQQMEDLLEAQEQISKTLREQLKKSRQEIQRLKDENKITEEDYRQRLAKLMEDQQNSQELIADMAKEYSQMDYDQMDSLNQRISDAILNGRLMEADSLLRSKGDMTKRIAEVRREQQAEAQEEQELAQRQENLEASKEGTKKKLEDIAADCYKFFDRFKLENQHDSAAYYIELRAELDTTNADWQFNAAKYYQTQNQFRKSEIYYERALSIYCRLAQASPQTGMMGNNIDRKKGWVLDCLGQLYYDTKRFAESENMYKKALEIRKRLATFNPRSYEPELASTLNNLAGLYQDTKRFDESELMHEKALEIRRRLADTNPEAYEPAVAGSLNTLGLLFLNTKKYAGCESIFKEALEIRRKWAKINPHQYEPGLAKTLNNMGLLFLKTHRYGKSEEMFKEALEIRKRLSDANPQAYEQDYSKVLNNLAFLYSKMQMFEKSEALYLEALEIRKRLAELNPQVNRPSLVKTMRNLADLYQQKHMFKKSSELYLESLTIDYQQAKKSPRFNERTIAQTLNNLSLNSLFLKDYSKAEHFALEGIEADSTLHGTARNLASSLLFQGKFQEAKKIYIKFKDELKDSFLDDFRQFAEAGVIPEEREADVERIKKILEQ